MDAEVAVMSYAIYLRKSRADAEAEAMGEGETLARHEAALTTLAARSELEIGAIYRELASGETIAARPVMQILLEEVERGLWEGVLVMEVERLARGDTIDQGIVAQSFKYSSTKIITPGRTYDPCNEFDEEYFEFGLFMSRREYKTINRRLQRGRAASVYEGKYVGNIAPFGYDRIKLMHQKGFSLTPNKEEAEIVALIFSLYTQGVPEEDEICQHMGANQIAERLNTMGILTRRGGHWTAGTVLGILHNPVYIGQLQWNKRPAVKTVVNGKLSTSRPRSKDCILRQGLHPPLVSGEAWDTAQCLFSPEHTVKSTSCHQVKNPLAGLVLCGVCGCVMQRRPYKGRADGLICTTPGCPTVGSDLTLVEDRILEALSLWFSNDCFPPDFLSRRIVPDTKVQIRHCADHSVSTLEKQLSVTYEMLERGVYTPEVFTKRQEELLARLRYARDAIAGVCGESESDALPQAQHAAPQRHDIAFSALYRCTTDPLLRSRLLKAAVRQVIYTKEAGGRWNFDMRAGFQLDLFMNFPQTFFESLSSEHNLKSKEG